MELSAPLGPSFEAIDWMAKAPPVAVGLPPPSISFIQTGELRTLL